MDGSVPCDLEYEWLVIMPGVGEGELTPVDEEDLRP